MMELRMVESRGCVRVGLLDSSMAPMTAESRVNGSANPLVAGSVVSKVVMREIAKERLRVDRKAYERVVKRGLLWACAMAVLMGRLAAGEMVGLSVFLKVDPTELLWVVRRVASKDI